MKLAVSTLLQHLYLMVANLVQLEAPYKADVYSEPPMYSCTFYAKKNAIIDTDPISFLCITITTISIKIGHQSFNIFLKINVCLALHGWVDY